MEPCTVLGFPASPGDEISTYSDNNYTTYVFDENELKWLPSEPSITLGQALFCRKKTPGIWIRKTTAVP